MFSENDYFEQFVWCKKRCKYQTMFETNMCSIHFLHSNAHHTPKTHQLHHIFEEYLFINILCLVSQVYTKKGPTDSILLGEVIRVGSKALVVGGAEASSSLQQPTGAKIDRYSTETPKSLVVSWLRSLLPVPVGNMSITGKCLVTSCISCLGVLVVSYIGVELLSTSRWRH